MSVSEQRYDQARLSKSAQITPQGFVRLPAYFTRTGIFEYVRNDGKIVREYRPPEQVFHPESIASLSSAPVTDMHQGMVTPENAKALTVGIVGERVDQNGKYLSGSVLIMDAAMISAVNSAKRREISCGYRCKIQNTPGEVDGQRYDCIQTDIRYNHVALGPMDWGRAGGDVALRLDSDAIQTCDPDDWDPEDVHHEDGGGSPMEAEITVNGVAYKVTKEVAQAYAVEKARMDARVSELEKTEGRLDAIDAELKAAMAALEEASDTKRFDSAVNDRVVLITKAVKVLGEGERFDGVSRREIMVKTLAKLSPGVALDGKSDDYVEARFDHAVEVAAQSHGKAREAAFAAAGKATEERIDSATALKNFKARTADAWKQPLRHSRDA